MAKGQVQTGAQNGLVLSDVVAKFQNFFAELNQLFFERTWELIQIKYAILIQEHVLLKGAPGTAKSMLGMKVFNGISGAEVYKNQFTRMQDDSYVFGPQLIDEFKKGRVVHNVTGSLVTADFAFMDEFFNASEETLVATLEPLNERTFTRPAQKEKCPLISAIITTNQDREDEKELRAVYDRIIFKSDVKHVLSADNRVAMYRNYLSGATVNTNPTIDFSEVKFLLDELKKFDPMVTDGMLQLFDSVVSEYESQLGVSLSPRRKNKLLGIVKASMFLSGRTGVSVDDLQEIKYGLVEGGNTKELSYFDTVFRKVSQLVQRMEMVGKMQSLFKDSMKNKNSTEAYKIAVGISKKCEKLVDEFKSDASSSTVIPMLTSLKADAQARATELEGAFVKDSDIFGEAGKK